MANADTCALDKSAGTSARVTLATKNRALWPLSGPLCESVIQMGLLAVRMWAGLVWLVSSSQSMSSSVSLWSSMLELILALGWAGSSCCWRVRPP